MFPRARDVTVGLILVLAGTSGPRDVAKAEPSPESQVQICIESAQTKQPNALAACEQALEAAKKLPPTDRRATLVVKAAFALVDLKLDAGATAGAKALSALIASEVDSVRDAQLREGLHAIQVLTAQLISRQEPSGSQQVPPPKLPCDAKRSDGDPQAATVCAMAASLEAEAATKRRDLPGAVASLSRGIEFASKHPILLPLRLTIRIVRGGLLARMLDSRFFAESEAAVADSTDPSVPADMRFKALSMRVRGLVEFEDWKDARDAAERLTSVAKSLPSSSSADLHLGEAKVLWAGVLVHLGLPQRSVELAREALVLLARRSGEASQVAVAWAQVVLGEGLAGSGSPEKATAAFQEAMKLVPALPDSAVRATVATRALFGRAVVATTQAEFDGFLLQLAVLAGQLSDISDPIERDYYRAKLHARRGWLFVAAGRPQEAQQAFEDEFELLVAFPESEKRSQAFAELLGQCNLDRAKVLLALPGMEIASVVIAKRALTSLADNPMHQTKAVTAELNLVLAESPLTDATYRLRFASEVERLARELPASERSDRLLARVALLRAKVAAREGNVTKVIASLDSEASRVHGFAHIGEWPNWLDVLLPLAGNVDVAARLRDLRSAMPVNKADDPDALALAIDFGIAGNDSAAEEAEARTARLGTYCATVVGKARSSCLAALKAALAYVVRIGHISPEHRFGFLLATERALAASVGPVANVDCRMALVGALAARAYQTGSSNAVPSACRALKLPSDPRTALAVLDERVRAALPTEKMDPVAEVASIRAATQGRNLTLVRFVETTDAGGAPCLGAFRVDSRGIQWVDMCEKTASQSFSKTLATYMDNLADPRAPSLEKAGGRAAELLNGGRQRGSVEALQLDGSRIAGAIWTPLDVRTSGVVIVPSGSLQLLPFHALPAGHGRFLIEDMDIRYAVSATTAFEREKALDAAPAVLIMGDPDIQDPPEAAGSIPNAKATSRLDRQDPVGVRALAAHRTRPDKPTRSASDLKNASMADLPFALLESQEVARLTSKLLPTAAVSFRYRQWASERAFRALAPKSRFVHVSAHGFFMDVPAELRRLTAGKPIVDVPSDYSRYGLTVPSGGVFQDLIEFRESPDLASGLVLAGFKHTGDGRPPEDDGILTAAELRGLDLRGVDLVVLSACQSGVGVNSNGVVEGFRSAFFRAGVRNVILSLWPVEDRSTEALMTGLYEKLWSGRVLLPSSALIATMRAALANLRKKGEEPHPFFWAPFVAIGPD
jgi:CHAT domain-containing protein/tetratricopeptide (TPR) repeat protein